MSIDTSSSSSAKRAGLNFTGDWQQRMASIVEMMREMSRQTDPQAMVRDYLRRMGALMPATRRLSMSRRGLEYPYVRITRDNHWKEEINPWKEPHKLPLLAGGLLGELIYSNEPAIIDDLQVSPDDPAYSILGEHRSLVALPLFDQGEALNMAIAASSEPAAFEHEQFPERVWMANLFGQATNNLVMADKLEAAYKMVDYEMKIVADIQHALLPADLPSIPNLRLAAHYQTSRRAGGDYYDFFPLPDGKWGILLADASGHGAPAAVVMAITHSIAHSIPERPSPPARFLNYLNEQLADRYTARFGGFVTAFYGVFDPATRELRYASAGHNPPRVKQCGCGTLRALDRVGQFPLGIASGLRFEEATVELSPGDRLALYTDGITEAANAQHEAFGTERLDVALAHCGRTATELVQAVVEAVDEFTAGQPPEDDRTLVVAEVA